MDYRELLRKYITHVGNCEGITFINEFRRDSSLFSAEEWEELLKLDDEAD